MKIDRFVRVMLVLIAVLLALNCAKDFSRQFNSSRDFSNISNSSEGWVSRAEAQSANRYSYLHFKVGACGGRGGIGSQGVIDLRNGNVWCLLPNGDAPIFEGTLNLAAIPASAPGR